MKKWLYDQAFQLASFMFISWMVMLVIGIAHGVDHRVPAFGHVVACAVVGVGILIAECDRTRQP